MIVMGNVDGILLKSPSLGNDKYEHNKKTQYGTYGYDITPSFCSLSGKFGKLPSINKAMSPVVFRPILATFREQL